MTQEKRNQIDDRLGTKTLFLSSLWMFALLVFFGFILVMGIIQLSKKFDLYGAIELGVFGGCFLLFAILYVLSFGWRRRYVSFSWETKQ